MSFNLIQEAWIPLSDGGRVRPAEVIACTRRGAHVDWPRADFSGATWEFLIGLVQCSALLPADDGAWAARWTTPPTLAEVDDALAPLAEAFDLDGAEGPRFLQDASAADGKAVGIAALLIDSPGDNALTRNMDVFVKRGGADRACPACAAAAVYTMQTYAPSGGQGHRTSLRGGGPLTTLVVADDPWHTIWANVLPREALDTLTGRADPFAPGPLFPWMAPLRLSDGEGTETLPGQAPFLQAFWGQPRRFWLDFDTCDSGLCALCGDHSDRLVSRMFTKPRGVNYEGGWMHPLSPYSREAGKPETAAARKGSPQGPDYRQWFGLVEARAESGKRQRLPAAAVTHFRHARRSETLRLWAFGYDTDNMKARGWNDSRMPLHPEMDDADGFADAVARALGVVDVAVWACVQALRKALLNDAGNAKAEFPAERLMLLSRTRDDFFALLDTLRARDAAGDSLDADDVTPLLRDWHGRLARVAIDAFDDSVEVAPLEISKARQVAQARRDLINTLWGKPMAKASALVLDRKTRKKKEAA